MIKQCPDLEIRIDRGSSSDYTIEYRLASPGSDADAGSSMQEALRMVLDVGALQQLSLDCQGYGRMLTEALFVPNIRDAFRDALTVADQNHEPLRVRLYIGATARELHGLRWETLQNPHDLTFLSINERVLFSRYVTAEDNRPFKLPPKKKLRALVAVANPKGLEQYKLAAINVSEEVERARKSLEGIEYVELASGGLSTLDTILDSLRDGYDICYLVCHGSFQAREEAGGVKVRESFLWLEKKDGTIDRIPGRRFVEGINQLPECPRLFILASCDSGGANSGNDIVSEDTLAALGPQLASAGVPAVLAMQGSIAIDTVETFMPILFRELMQQGTIDRAVAIARKSIRDKYDWWSPVLYTRLKSGRLWYTPGFVGDARGQEQMWTSMVELIETKQCTPILGLGVCEAIFGSRHELATQWAEAYQYPMAPYERDDFPRVAQYLAVDQFGAFPRNKLIQTIRLKCLSFMSEPQRQRFKAKPLYELIESVSSDLRKAHSIDPYKVLAELDLPIYVTTDPTDLLVAALRERGKDPVREYSRWQPYLEDLPTELKNDQEYEPSSERPLVFQLFGTFRVEESLVITEDNYLDFLIGFTKNREILPKVLRYQLVKSGLLFLGFQLEEWNFRVLLRCLASMEGRVLLQEYKHVSAQIDPEKIDDPEAARRYLEKYFQTTTATPNVNIYWGSLENCLGELVQHRWDLVT